MERKTKGSFGSKTSSKYWSEMFLSGFNNPGGSNNSEEESGFIISKEEPVEYKGNKKITFDLIDLINDTDKNRIRDEVSEFYSNYNRMSTGNTTLLPRSELDRYLSLDNVSILMRSSKSNHLIGSIISLEIPVINKSSDGKKRELITHGCTTFLTVHPSIRNHGMCMALIRRLIGEGFKRGVYCDYHTVSFKLGDNSIPLRSWYRPLNLSRSIELGFYFPDCWNQGMKTRNRLRYKTKLPSHLDYIGVSEHQVDLSLNLYRSLSEGKRFLFYPDRAGWKKWVKAFPTYIIRRNSIPVGIVSLNTVYCVIGSSKPEESSEKESSESSEKGKLVTPVVCLGDMKSVIPVLIHLGHKEGYDVLYLYEYGDVTEEILLSVNAIRTDNINWFSLYNNKIELTKEDISVPIL